MTLRVMGEIEEGNWSQYLLWLPGVTAPPAPSFGVLGSGLGAYHRGQAWPLGCHQG